MPKAQTYSPQLPYYPKVNFCASLQASLLSLERSLVLLAIQYVYQAETTKFSITHPTPSSTRSANLLSYGRETKSPLMCLGHASQAWHLGEPCAMSAKTKPSQQQESTATHCGQRCSWPCLPTPRRLQDRLSKKLSHLLISPRRQSRNKP